MPKLGMLIGFPPFNRFLRNIAAIDDAMLLTASVVMARPFLYAGAW